MLFNRDAQAHITKDSRGKKNAKLFWLNCFFFSQKKKQPNRQRSETGLTILFGLLIISHLPQCRSNGIRRDARTLHIFGLSARTCECEPKIQEEREREREKNELRGTDRGIGR